jgi:hypothetical protein
VSKPSCSICGGTFYARGWCYKHYRRWQRHGDPLHERTRGVKSVADVEKRAAKENDHWLWSQVNTQGYAKADMGGKTVALHRWVYEQACGPIPDGLEIDHLCRVRNCVNPAHLEPVTGAENKRRSREARGIYDQCPKGHARDVSTIGRTGLVPRCAECQRQSRRKVVAEGIPANAVHGNCTTYNLGCRCDACRAARSTYDKHRRAQRLA